MARPKLAFTPEQEQKIEEYALNNCNMGTIATALGIAKNTLARRYGAIIKKKRAQGRIRLRAYQNNLAKHNPAMAIFLGKNELDQTDKQVITTEHKLPELSEAEQKAYKAMAEDWKLRIARQGAENVQRQDKTA